MYIEDILGTLDSIGKTSKWDKNVIESLTSQVMFNGNGFTEKQSQLALKIIRRYQDQLDDYYRKDITTYLDTPVYRLAIRTPAANYRKVSMVSHPQWVKAIKVEFPYNESFVNLIRENRSDSNFAVWEKEAKAWMFSLSETNIKLVKTLAESDVFDVDAEFKEYSSQVDDIFREMEKFTPMLVVDAGKPKYVNAPRYIPELKTDNILKSVFEARKAGIDIWDEQVDEVIESDNLNDFVRSFIRTPATSQFHVDSTNSSMNVLSEIVQYLEPALIIIPGGMELTKTETAYEFLKEQGLTNEEISVMFRLPGNTGKNFNDFVKLNNLNNPITEKTRAVVVSQKMPKPVLTSKIKFNCVISLGLHNMHYTIRDFTKNCPNLIYYCEQRPNKELDFGHM